MQNNGESSKRSSSGCIGLIPGPAVTFPLSFEWSLRGHLLITFGLSMFGAARYPTVNVSILQHHRSGYLSFGLPQLDATNKHRLHGLVQEGSCSCDCCLQGLWVAGLQLQVEWHRLFAEGWVILSCRRHPASFKEDILPTASSNIMHESVLQDVLDLHQSRENL